jgi:MFS transporter, PAT family, solute carrier family 33 (acetyl-CoA transportor), member 1
MIFFGIVFIVVTTLVLFFKKEKVYLAEEDELTVFETYKVIWKIVCLRPVQILIALLLTSKVEFIFLFNYI